MGLALDATRFPKLVALKARVEALPNIKAYLQRRDNLPLFPTRYPEDQNKSEIVILQW